MSNFKILNLTLLGTLGLSTDVLGAGSGYGYDGGYRSGPAAEADEERATLRENWSRMAKAHNAAEDARYTSDVNAQLNRLDDDTKHAIQVLASKDFPRKQLIDIVTLPENVEKFKIIAMEILKRPDYMTSTEMSDWKNMILSRDNLLSLLEGASAQYDAKNYTVVVQALLECDIESIPLIIAVTKLLLPKGGYNSRPDDAAKLIRTLSMNLQKGYLDDAVKGLIVGMYMPENTALFNNLRDPGKYITDWRASFLENYKERPSRNDEITKYYANVDAALASDAISDQARVDLTAYQTIVSKYRGNEAPARRIQGAWRNYSDSQTFLKSLLDPSSVKITEVMRNVFQSPLRKFLTAAKGNKALLDQLAKKIKAGGTLLLTNNKLEDSAMMYIESTLLSKISEKGSLRNALMALTSGEEASAILSPAQARYLLELLDLMESPLARPAPRAGSKDDWSAGRARPAPTLAARTSYDDMSRLAVAPTRGSFDRSPLPSWRAPARVAPAPSAPTGFDDRDPDDDSVVPAMSGGAPSLYTGPNPLGDDDQDGVPNYRDNVDGVPNYRDNVGGRKDSDGDGTPDDLDPTPYGSAGGPRPLMRQDAGLGLPKSSGLGMSPMAASAASCPTAPSLGVPAPTRGTMSANYTGALGGGRGYDSSLDTSVQLTREQLAARREQDRLAKAAADERLAADRAARMSGLGTVSVKDRAAAFNKTDGRPPVGAPAPRPTYTAGAPNPAARVAAARVGDSPVGEDPDA